VQQLPANIVECGLAEQAVALRVIELVGSALEDMLVKMHAIARFAEQGLGHEGHGLACLPRDHLAHILDRLHRVRGGHHAHQRRFDLALARPADLMVVVLDRDLHAFEGGDDPGPQRGELIARRNGVIPPVQGYVVPVPAFRAVPVRFRGIDPIRSHIDAVFVGNAVEDVELELGSPAAFVRDTCLFQIGLGTLGNDARITKIEHLRIRLDDTADKAQGRHFPERIEDAGVEIGDEHHIAGLDAAQPDARAVEADASDHQVRRELAGRERHMVPPAPQIAELEVDHAYGVFTHKRSRNVEVFQLWHNNTLLCVGSAHGYIIG